MSAGTDLDNTDPTKPVIVLFRHDLRIADNGALHAASQSGKPVLPVFILDESGSGSRPRGGASHWWLHHSLHLLSADLEKLGAPLVLLSGPQNDIVRDLVAQIGADAVVWNRRYDPAGVEADTDLKAALKDAGVAGASHEGHLLHEPWQVKTGSGGPYRVYTPFWRAITSGPEPRSPFSRPRKLSPVSHAPKGDSLDAWKLLPAKPDWAGGIREAWQPGEAGAHARLDHFLKAGLDGYEKGRDFPDRESTSRLSPHLAFGEITPFQIWQALANRKLAGAVSDSDKFRKEVGWREFSWHLLFHNPELDRKNFNPAFDGFGWTKNENALKAWQRGQTGYPIVDAGMRQLWQTGWMHNRVRMVVASFLVKHLLIDWRQGEQWFWDTLVDADLANNPASWQWVAGTGADAAPYFRVFNPVLQGRKFDPNGDYVRAFVPELAKIDAEHLHDPWNHKAELQRRGVKLGSDYPVPIIDHDKARDRALQAYQDAKGTA